jgi:pimeloyl-ACP methyl ester carboxylesterase
MDTDYTRSLDGTRIAYDRQGAGPPLILLHGGGGSRQDWHEAGYVQHLQDQFTVITMDLRGHGESDRPVNAAAYSTSKMVQDVLAVADANDVEQFILWGMSFGSKIARYTAVFSDRVSRLILLSAQLGLGVVGDLRQQAIDFVAHWPPILQAEREGTLDRQTLSAEDQAMLRDFDVPVILAWVRAMLDWPAVEPADLCCPTLWLLGSKDDEAMQSLAFYAESLPGSTITAHVLQGLDHNEAFEATDQVLPLVLAFCAASAGHE